MLWRPPSPKRGPHLCQVGVRELRAAPDVVFQVSNVTLPFILPSKSSLLRHTQPYPSCQDVILVLQVHPDKRTLAALISRSGAPGGGAVPDTQHMFAGCLQPQRSQPPLFPTGYLFNFFMQLPLGHLKNSQAVTECFQHSRDLDYMKSSTSLKYFGAVINKEHFC